MNGWIKHNKAGGGGGGDQKMGEGVVHSKVILVPQNLRMAVCKAASGGCNQKSLKNTCELPYFL